MGENTINIRVSRENRIRLAEFGKAGESFDDALGRVLDLAEESKYGAKKGNKSVNPLMAALRPIPA